MLPPLSLPDAAMLANLDKDAHLDEIVGLSKPDGGCVPKTHDKGTYSVATRDTNDLAVVVS